MATQDDIQIDEAPNSENISPEPKSQKKARAYAPLQRNLSEKELMNIGSVNFLIEDNERLERETLLLQDIRDKHHELDKANAVLLEKLCTYKLLEIAYNISISVGALFIGLAKPLWDVEFYGLVALIGGAALWISGTVMKLGRMFIK